MLKTWPSTVIAVLLAATLLTGGRTAAGKDGYTYFLPLILADSDEVATPTWKVFPSPTEDSLTDVFALSSTDVWVTSDRGNIYHWDGSTWHSYILSIFTSPNSIVMSAESEGFAFSSQVYRWDGSAWLVANGIVPGTPYYLGFKTIVDFDGFDYWFAHVEHFEIIGGDSQSYTHLNSWNTESQTGKQYDFTGWRLGDIDMVLPTEGWMVGYNETDFSGRIFYWNGHSWKEEAHPEIYATSGITAFDSSHVWVIGQTSTKDCIALSWDGVIWSTVTCPSAYYFNAIDHASANLSWAVGTDGAIAYSSGSDWILTTSPVRASLEAIDMLSETEGWAVGRGGVILKYSAETN